MTPTNSCLGRLDPATLSKADETGAAISGDKPTKEAFLHLSMYAQRPGAGAIVHLHSTHSVAVSVLTDIDHENPIPPLTAYYVMKIGRLALLPYYAPGDVTLANAVREVAGRHHAILLANHGPVVAGKDLETAVYATEELEETAKLYLLLRGQQTKLLTVEQVAELHRKFPA
jgi:3-dehydro-4-phosphotetronate decarboxylase